MKKHFILMVIICLVITTLFGFTSIGKEKTEYSSASQSLSLMSSSSATACLSAVNSFSGKKTLSGTDTFINGVKLLKLNARTANNSLTRLKNFSWRERITLINYFSKRSSLPIKNFVLENGLSGLKSISKSKKQVNSEITPKLTESATPDTTSVQESSSIPYVNDCDPDTHVIFVDVERNKSKYKMYQVDVATDAEFKNIVSSDLYDFGFMVITGLSPDTQYYVRTRGFDGSDYSDFSAAYSVRTEAVEVESVTLEAKHLEMFAGDTKKLSAEVLPTDANDKTVVWTSTDETVATVSQDGTITAVGPGNAAVIVTTANSERDACEVHVDSKLISGQTETLVPDKSTLNGNAVFGRYYIPASRNLPVEQNVTFDGTYHLGSFEEFNSMIDSTYYFGGVSSETSLWGIPFTYTWTEDSDFTFDGNDCALVSDNHSTQTLGFVGAGAYDKIYLLSLADDYAWNNFTKRWEMSNGDVIADVKVTYKDGSSENKTVNFGNMMTFNEKVPSCDSYILSSTSAGAGNTFLGSEGQAPYMYGIPVECNPEKQIESVTLTINNDNEKRRVNLAVFAVSGHIGESAPEAVDESDTSVTNLSEYGFNFSWKEIENADGYYAGIFEDEDCTSPCYLNILSKKTYVCNETFYTPYLGFSNESYNPGKTYYVKIASFNENGTSKATVVPVTTIGTYPKEIKLSPKTADLSIGESVNLSAYFPDNSYYTYSKIAWSVSDTSVLRVSDGKVTAVGAGTATVRAALEKYPDIYAECTVTVAPYGDGWTGYDNGVFLDDSVSVGFKRKYAEMQYGAIRVTSEQTGSAVMLDKIQYYVSRTEDVEYDIYLVEKGKTPFAQEPVASGTIPSSSTGWKTVSLDKAVEMTEGKEIWIAIDSDYISRSDNESENGGLGKVEGHWISYDSVGFSGTIMVRAHFTEKQ